MARERPSSRQRSASSMATRIAWLDSGAGRMPSARTKRTPASKHRVWATATASIRPPSTARLNSGPIPWARRPPAWTGGGTNVCPSVCIRNSGPSRPVSA